MTTTLVPDTRTDRHAIARALVEVDHADHEAGLWRELADFLAEPLALHNLLAAGQPVPRAAWVPAVPFHRRDTALDTLGARVRASIEPENYCKWHDLFDCPYSHAPHEREDGPEPEPENVLTDVAPRRGGKRRRWARPTRWQRAIDAVRKGWRDEIGAPVRPDETGDQDEVRL